VVELDLPPVGASPPVFGRVLRPFNVVLCNYEPGPGVISTGGSQLEYVSAVWQVQPWSWCRTLYSPPEICTPPAAAGGIVNGNTKEHENKLS
jgi:hypothetical protein